MLPTSSPQDMSLSLPTALPESDLPIPVQKDIFSLFEDKKAPSQDEIKAFAKEINKQNASLMTPLLVACQKAMKRDIIELMIRLGADVRATDRNGNTALHYVIHLDIATLLVSCQVDAYRDNVHGEKPYQSSYARSRTPVTKAFLHVACIIYDCLNQKAGFHAIVRQLTLIPQKEVELGLLNSHPKRTWKQRVFQSILGLRPYAFICEQLKSHCLSQYSIFTSEEDAQLFRIYNSTIREKLQSSPTALDLSDVANAGHGGLLHIPDHELAHIIIYHTGLAALNLANTMANMFFLCPILEKNYTLTALNLSNLPQLQTSEGIRSVAGMIENSALLIFKMNHNRLPLDDMRVFCAALEANTRLQELEIRFDQIDPPGIECLVTALMINTTLQVLDIFGNPFGDQGAGYLVNAFDQGISLPKLKYGHNGIHIGEIGQTLRSIVHQRNNQNLSLALLCTQKMRISTPPFQQIEELPLPTRSKRSIEELILPNKRVKAKDDSSEIPTMPEAICQLLRRPLSSVGLHIFGLELERYGVNVDVMDTLGRTPLHIACQNNFDVIHARLFINDLYANPNSRDHQGNTPLHYVKGPDMALFLVQSMADPCQKNLEGLVPFKYYSQTENPNEHITAILYIAYMLKKCAESDDALIYLSHPSFRKSLDVYRRYRPHPLAIENDFLSMWRHHKRYNNFRAAAYGP